jgi:hypothetical protein
MAIARAQMEKQITNPPKPKKKNKITYMKNGGQCKGMGAATRGGNFTVR